MDIPRPTQADLAWYTEGGNAERKVILEFLRHHMDELGMKEMKQKFCIAHLCDDIEAGKHWKFA